jgi:hypothetical protein
MFASALRYAAWRARVRAAYKKNRWVSGSYLEKLKEIVMWEGEGAYLFLVVQALVVIFKYGLAFCRAAVVFGGCVGYIACEDFLPEGEAAGWAWRWVS